MRGKINTYNYICTCVCVQGVYRQHVFFARARTCAREYIHILTFSTVDRAGASTNSPPVLCDPSCIGATFDVPPCEGSDWETHKTAGMATSRLAMIFRRLTWGLVRGVGLSPALMKKLF